MRQESKMYNARPSKISNLGKDILGAARHDHDTYETNEQREAKAFKKTSTKAVHQLKGLALETMTELNFLAVIQSYEISRTLYTCEQFATFGPLSSSDDTNAKLAKIKTFVLSLSGDYKAYSSAADKFNRLCRVVRKLRYNIQSLTDAQEYFEPKTKTSFVEDNGIKSPWKTTAKALKQSTQDYLSLNTLGLQFGNSIPDVERIYCSENLEIALSLLANVFTFDFAKVGFSFGARGKAGSVAHYEPSAKVIAMNRHRDGALAHEVGHAVDYAMGEVSKQMPFSIIDPYRAKLRKSSSGSVMFNYYRQPVEIFARIFEQYVYMKTPCCPTFLQSTRNESVMPDMTPETIAWFESVLSPILKEGA